MIVDTLIHARWIIPVEPESVTYEHHTLVIDSGKIIDLLPTDHRQTKIPGDDHRKSGKSCVAARLDQLPYPCGNDFNARYRR